MSPHVVKETMALTFEKNTASNELAKHRNQVCKTRHPKKFASLKLVQLAPRSFCHAVDGIWEQPSKSNFSRGEFPKTSSRSAAASAPLVSLSKHLKCSKGDCVDQRTAICCRSSCKWPVQVRPFSTVYFTFLAFQCCQMLSKKQPWQWALTFEKNTASKELAKHRNQVCKTRHALKFASLKLVQLAPRSFCHAVDGIIRHPWRFRDTRLQCARSSRTSPHAASWLGSPPSSLKRSTNWWKATSENFTRPLQSMSFTKFFLSLVSMSIKASPRAATAALGTWHARSRSSCWELSYLKLDIPRLQRCAWESKAATKDDNLMGSSFSHNLMDSSFSPSSCAATRELFCIPAVGLGQGVMMLVHDQSWNSTHGGLSYQIIEGMWFLQKHGANLPPKMVKGSL